MQEILDIYDEAGRHTGTAPRDEVHARGLLHQVVHCWVVGESEPVLYFQQRAHDKRDFPDYYDLACGGHIDAGETPQRVVVREVREEIGLHIAPEQLDGLGQYRAPDLRLSGFFDRETSNVYVLRQDAPPFVPGEEVSRMICVHAREFCRMELGGAQEIPVQTLDGTVFRTARSEWCCHDGEFAEKVLPYLRAAFPQMDFSGAD